MGCANACTKKQDQNQDKTIQMNLDFEESKIPEVSSQVQNWKKTFDQKIKQDLIAATQANEAFKSPQIFYMVKIIIFCSYIAGKGKPENAGIIIESEIPYISCKDMSKLEKHMEQMLLTYNLLTTFFSQSQQLQACSEQVEQYDKTILDLPNVVNKHYEQQGKEQELSQEQRILRGNTAKYNNLKNLMLELKKQVTEAISDNQKALQWKDQEAQKKWLEQASIEAAQKQHTQPAEAVNRYWMDIPEKKNLK